MRISPDLVAGAVVFVLVSGLPVVDLEAQTPSSIPVGTWFGIARSCTSPTRFPQPPNTVDQSICREACGGAACAPTTFPIDEVTMMPELFADGNVVATDNASLVAGHTTGQGRWETAGTAVIDGKRFDRVVASFMWFQPRPPQEIDSRNPWGRFGGVVRPRFVMYFDPDHPDIVQGYLQPFLFSITDRFGVVQLEPGTPFPTPDPAAPLPQVCDPTARTNPYCFGTFMFVVRRVQPR